MSFLNTDQRTSIMKTLVKLVTILIIINTDNKN